MFEWGLIELKFDNPESRVCPNAATSTIESKTNFFRGVRGGQVTATARPLHVGGRTIVVHTEIRDDAGKLIALVIQTQAVLDGSPRSR